MVQQTITERRSNLTKEATDMDEFKPYRKSSYIEARQLEGYISIPQYMGTGVLSGRTGDWLARDPHNHADRWIIGREYFRYITTRSSKYVRRRTVL